MKSVPIKAAHCPSGTQKRQSRTSLNSDRKHCMSISESYILSVAQKTSMLRMLRIFLKE